MAIGPTTSAFPEKDTFTPTLPAGLLGVVQVVTETLVSQNVCQWEVRLAVKTDSAGCKDLHVHFHSCIEHHESEEPRNESSPGGAAGYLQKRSENGSHAVLCSVRSQSQFP